MPTIYERLVELKLKALKGSVDYPEAGICRNADCYEFSKENAEHYPDFSGDIDFPVPYLSFDPSISYNLSFCYRDQFDLSTEYSRNRMRYLDFLINRAKLQGV